MFLPPEDVPRAIRSAPLARDVSSEQLELLHRALRALPYEQYLQTPWWRAVRNRALHLAGFRCTRCDAKRELQVHHRTYERLGAELDEDLDVLCRGCHLGEHFNQTQDEIGLYVRVLSEVLTEQKLEDFSDILDEAKRRCSRRRIEVHVTPFHAAVARVVPRFPFSPPAEHAELYDVGRRGEPFTRSEAAGILAKLNAARLVKHMPEAKPMTLRQAERGKALRILAQGILLQVERCEEAEREPEDAK